MACNGDSTTLPKAFSELTGTASSTQLPGGTPTGTGAVVMGTNPTIVIGTGGAITTSGSGTVAATHMNGVQMLSTGSGTVGKIPIDQGNGTSVWADPLVQGTQASGTTSSTVNPVLTGVAFNTTQPTVTNGQLVTLQGTARGAQIVATGVDTFSVAVSNFPASQAVTGTFFQATQPVSAASLPLPTGASTSAKQPALGTAGSASADVITVQGIASMTALKVDGSAVTQPVSGTVTANAGSGTFNTTDANAQSQGSATSGQKGFLELGAVTTAAPAYSTTQSSPLSLTTAGGLRTDQSSQAGTAITTVPTAFGTGTPSGNAPGVQAALYVGTTACRSNQTTTATGVQDVNIVGSLGATNSVTNGTFMAITDNTTKAGVIVATTALKTDMSSVAGTATVTAAAGVQKVGVVGNANATLDAAIGGAAPTNALWNTNAPATASAAACSAGNAASLTVLNIKASAGNVYGVTVVNKTASVIYLQFYNTAGTPTLGTSVISWIPVAASGVLVIPPGSLALSNYATGIGIGASTTPTSTGTPGTAPDVTIWFK
jgi:hypothetical protein